MMNFQQFKTWREQYLQQHTPSRLDCMNPFLAMQFLKHPPTPAAHCSLAELIEQWSVAMQAQSWCSYALPSSGVRASLHALFKTLALQQKALWLPNDIYPFYAEAAQQAGIQANGFNSWPTLDWQALTNAAANSVLLLTNPQNPSGTYFSAQQTLAIQNWLSASPQRRLILDTVYCYDTRFDEHTQTLWETGQCFICHSLAKAWLAPNSLGILLCPTAEQANIQPWLTPLSSESCHQAASALQQHELPHQQQQAFNQEWQRLLPTIHQFAPNFTPPPNGYFAIAQCDFESALQHQSLTIPASVFGTHKSDWVVVSCLYEIKRQRGDG